MDTKLSAHIMKSDCTCRCCGHIGPYPANLTILLKKLEELWVYLKNKYKRIPKLHFTCVYRCPAHNRAEGGVEGSYHTLDFAADIWENYLGVDELAKACEAVGFHGVGRYYTLEFVHTDMGGEPGRRWIE